MVEYMIRLKTKANKAYIQFAFTKEKSSSQKTNAKP